MFTKMVILIVMFIILLILGSGLIFLVRDDGKTDRTVKALTWRIAISLLLFFFLLIAFRLHWIQPHAIESTFQRMKTDAIPPQVGKGVTKQP